MRGLPACACMNETQSMYMHACMKKICSYMHWPYVCSPLAWLRLLGVVLQAWVLAANEAARVVVGELATMAVEHSKALGAVGRLEIEEAVEGTVAVVVVGAVVLEEC